MNFKLVPTQGREASSDGRAQRGDLGASSDGASNTNARTAPKRAGSFGKGLGTALANSMTRASEAVGKKTSASTPTATASGIAPSSAMAPPPTPDASHLYNFSLRLSELVNQALVSTVAHSQPLASGMTSVAKHASGRSAIPSIDQIIYEGRHLPNREKIQEIAQTVVAELQYARDIDAYLLRAVSRAALKALTLFATRIDALLVPVVKDPTSLIMPTTAKEGIHISPALEYNLGLATLTWIVEDALERCIEGDDGHDGMPGFVSEILTPVRKRMETTILHIIQPVLTGVKTSLTAALLRSVRQPFLSGGSPAMTPSLSLNDTVLPPLSPNQPPGSTVASPKSGVVGVETAVGNWLKILQGRLEGSRKLLVPRIEARTSQDGEGWFISVAVHVIWKALFIITARPIDPASAGAGQSSVAATPSRTASFWGGGSLAPHQHLNDSGKRTPSPGQISAALKSVAGVSRNRKSEANLSGLVSSGASETVNQGRSTPNATTPGADGLSSSILPKTAASLISAPALQKAVAAQLSDLQAFQKMALRFCKGFVSDKALSAVAAELSRADADEEVEEDAQLQEEDEEDELARQALAEALDALKSTIAVIQLMDSNIEGVRLALDRGTGRSPGGGSAPVDGNCSPVPSGGAVRPLDTHQSRALKAIPPLILLHIAYCRLPASLKVPAMGVVGQQLSSPPALFGITWAEYERSIAGFVGGGTWAQAAVRRWAKEVESLWQSYQAQRSELVSKRHVNSGEDVRRSQDSSEDGEVDGPEGSHIIEGMPVSIGGGVTRDLSDEFGTTPTATRGAKLQAARSNLGNDPSQPSSLALDISQATPRAVSDPPPCIGGHRDLRLSSRPSFGSEEPADSPFIQDAGSTFSSPVHSPPLEPMAAGPVDDDFVEHMEGSLGDLKLGSPAASSTNVATQQSTGHRGAASHASVTAVNKPEQQSEKVKFWKTSSSTSLASSNSSSASQSGAGGSVIQSPPSLSPSIGTDSATMTTANTSSPPVGTASASSSAVGHTSSSGSGVGAGAQAPSSSRGFHLPRALTRASFGSSRPSSPAGSLRSLGVRSRSSRRAETLPTALGNGSGGGGGVANPNAPEDSVDAEVAEVDRNLEALRFFARVVEWAAWGSGVDVRIGLGV